MKEDIGDNHLVGGTRYGEIDKRKLHVKVYRQGVTGPYEETNEQEGLDKIYRGEKKKYRQIEKRSKKAKLSARETNEPKRIKNAD